MSVPVYEISFAKKFEMIEDNGNSFECDFRVVGTESGDLPIAFREYISQIERFTEEKGIIEMKYIVRLTEPEQMNIHETFATLKTLEKRCENVKVQYMLANVLEKEMYIEKKSELGEKRCPKCSFLSLASLQCLCFPPYLEEIYRDFDNIHTTFKSEIRDNYKELLSVLSQKYDIPEKLKYVDPVYFLSLFDLNMVNEPIYVEGWIWNLKEYIEETEIVVQPIRRGKFTC